ncbi:MAG: alpha/beta hydrolase [Oligoflexia bacterium]|nr:alpha/beta hydrolase [Oligoflexia bacterium]
MTMQRIIFLSLLFLLNNCSSQSTLKEVDKNLASDARETVLDRKLHIEKEWIKEIPSVPRLCDALVPSTRKGKIDIGDGVKLYYEDEASSGGASNASIPIVLVSGGPGNTHHSFHPYFSIATRFTRVIYYDQRGTGLSDYTSAQGGYNTSQAVDDLLISGSIVIGHSYGGYLSQHYAVRYPATGGE